jgi:hypothetical protein
MASTKVQLDEMRKPNPRYILELHMIRGMIQEADNMDKGLKAVLRFGMRQPTVASGNGPPAPQPPAPHHVPLASAAVSRPPLPSLQSGHRKELSQAQGESASLNLNGMNSASFSALLIHFAGSIPIRRPTPEEIIHAERWVKEQKRTAFARGSLVQSFIFCVSDSFPSRLRSRQGQVC